MVRPSSKLDLEAEAGDEDVLAEQLFVGSTKQDKKSKKDKRKREHQEEDEEDDVKRKVKEPEDEDEGAHERYPRQEKSSAASTKKRLKKAEDGSDDEGQKKYQRLILFVGQIPFDASAQDIAKHFEDHGAGKVKVRLLTEKGTNKSRGMAFVDFETPQQLVRGLRVHKSRLLGRAINVERTVGGGGNNEARKDKLKQLRDYQGSQVRKEVEDLVTDALQRSAGLLDREVVDDLVVRSLCALPRDAVRQALDEILESDIANARNKKAWILGCIKRYISRLKTGEQFLTLAEEKAGIVEKRKEKPGDSRREGQGGRGGRGGREERGRREGRGGYSSSSTRGSSSSTRGSSSSSRGSSSSSRGRGGAESGRSVVNKFKRGGIGGGL